MKAWLLLSTLTSVAVLAHVGGVHERQALACSLAEASLEDKAANAEFIVVGEVVSEADDNVGSPVPTLPEAARRYKSTLQVAAALKGQPPRLFTIDDLGQLGADCSGGPRLVQGERLLLFVSHYASRTGRGALYVPGYEGGKYKLLDGYAKSAFAQPDTLPADVAIRAVAAVAGTPSTELDAALAFARGEKLPSQSTATASQPSTTSDKASKPPYTFIVIGVASAILATAAFLLFRRWRREG